MSRTRHHSKPFRDYDSPAFGLHNWLSNEPKIWRRLQKHKPRRCATKRALYKAKQDPDGDTMFPLDRKPWIYYW